MARVSLGKPVLAAAAWEVVLSASHTDLRQAGYDLWGKGTNLFSARAGRSR